jgi:hypothetical protein
VQMAIGLRKRAAAALPTVDEFVNRIRSDGTVHPLPKLVCGACESLDRVLGSISVAYVQQCCSGVAI